MIGVAIFQDFNQTFLQGENFGVTLTRSYTGTFGYALTPFIDTSLRASYSENQSTGVGNTSASRIRRRSPPRQAWSGGFGRG